MLLSNNKKAALAAHKTTKDNFAHKMGKTITPFAVIGHTESVSKFGALVRAKDPKALTVASTIELKKFSNSLRPNEWVLVLSKDSMNSANSESDYSW